MEGMLNAKLLSMSFKLWVTDTNTIHMPADSLLPKPLALCLTESLGQVYHGQSAVTCINTSCDFNFTRKIFLHKSWLTILIKRSHTQKLSLLTPISHISFSLLWMSGKFILSTSFEFQFKHCTWCRRIPNSF